MSHTFITAVGGAELPFAWYENSARAISLTEARSDMTYSMFLATDRNKELSALLLALVGTAITKDWYERRRSRILLAGRVK